MNKKQKKMLIRIIIAAVLIVVFSLLPAEGYLRFVLFMIPYLVGASTLARNKNYYKPQKCGLFYVKFYLFLCCTELYFIFICDIMRYETQL